MAPSASCRVLRGSSKRKVHLNKKWFRIKSIMKKVGWRSVLSWKPCCEKSCVQHLHAVQPGVVVSMNCDNLIKKRMFRLRDRCAHCALPRRHRTPADRDCRLRSAAPGWTFLPRGRCLGRGAHTKLRAAVQRTVAERPWSIFVKMHNRAAAKTNISIFRSVCSWLSLGACGWTELALAWHGCSPKVTDQSRDNSVKKQFSKVTIQSKCFKNRNLQERLVVVGQEWQSKNTDGSNCPSVSLTNWRTD